jgi:hypothetical protein
VTAHSKHSDPNPEEIHKNEFKKDSAKKRWVPAPYIHTWGTYLLHPMLAKPRAKGLQVRRLYAESWWSNPLLTNLSYHSLLLHACEQSNHHYTTITLSLSLSLVSNSTRVYLSECMRWDSNPNPNPTPNFEA